MEPEFFDFIIIDEAHHSEATTWKRALTYFNNAKVLKVTGTPFRSDGKLIKGKEVYTYGLGKAMARGYVKSLEKIDYIPGKVYLTLDKNSDELYTIEPNNLLNKRMDIYGKYLNRGSGMAQIKAKDLIVKNNKFLDVQLNNVKIFVSSKTKYENGSHDEFS